MSVALQTRAEIEKLARVLGRATHELEHLEQLAAHDIRALRHTVADALHEADRRHFAKVAGVAKAVPTAFAAKLAQHALGPLLAARVAGLLDADVACALASRLPPEFLADVAIELDPRQADAIIGCLPAGLIAAAARELDARGEHLAMGTFVGHIGDDALDATLAVLSDDALLRIGYLLEAPERLDAIYARLDDARVEAVVALAHAEGRAGELAGIAAHLGTEQRARLAA